MAGGHADDLAACVLMATDKPVLVAPAMNPRMWLNPATRRNVALLEADGVHFVGPNVGEMAERGESGPGRLAEVPDVAWTPSEGASGTSPSPSCRRRVFDSTQGEGVGGGGQATRPRHARRPPASSSTAARRTSPTNPVR
jgi:hypothetical protein